MNDTIQSILGILAEGKPELQIAAAQVLGELRPREAGVSKKIIEYLHGDDCSDVVARYLLQTLAHIGTDPAVRELVHRLEIPGPQADLASHLLVEMEEAVTKPLAQAFDTAGPESQARILQILSRIHSADSVPILEKALAVPALTARAGEALCRETLEQLDSRRSKAMRDRLVKHLGSGEAPAEVAAQMLLVLGRLDGSGARAELVRCTKPEQPALVRHAALSALEDVKLTPTQSEAMLDYLSEDNQEHVVAPTIALLEHVDNWRPQTVDRLKKLLSSRKEHLKVFALLAMRGVSSADLVKPLTNHLFGSSPELRSAAAEALSRNSAAKEPLLRAFGLEKDVARAELLAIPLSNLATKLTGAQIKSLGEKGSKLLVQGDPIGEVLLRLLIKVQPEKGPDFVVDKAIRMRRARKLNEALALLVFLAQNEAADGEGRYQLALVRLLLDGQAAAAGENAPAGDATMGHFALLVRDAFPVLERLTKESMVPPESLLRIGSHFASAVGAERKFGTDTLTYLAEKHPRQRAGEEARTMLKAGAY